MLWITAQNHTVFSREYLEKYSLAVFYTSTHQLTSGMISFFLFLLCRQPSHIWTISSSHCNPYCKRVIHCVILTWNIFNLSMEWSNWGFLCCVLSAWHGPTNRIISEGTHAYHSKPALCYIIITTKAFVSDYCSHYLLIDCNGWYQCKLNVFENGLLMLFLPLLCILCLIVYSGIYCK